MIFKFWIFPFSHLKLNFIDLCQNGREDMNETRYPIHRIPMEPSRSDGADLDELMECLSEGTSRVS